MDGPRAPAGRGPRGGFAAGARVARPARRRRPGDRRGRPRCRPRHPPRRPGDGGGGGRRRGGCGPVHARPLTRTPGDLRAAPPGGRTRPAGILPPRRGNRTGRTFGPRSSRLRRVRSTSPAACWTAPVGCPRGREMRVEMATTTPQRPTGSRAKRPFVLELYGTAVGKKYVMAITGIIGLGYVFAHMVGNLKLYFGAEEFNHYAHFLRELLYPIVPQTTTLWLLRLILIGALILHVVAAAQLTAMNRRARPERYQGGRDYIAADFAARTMRWTGVLVLLFIAYHLADFTWGWVNPAGLEAEPFERVVSSLSQPVVAAFYIVANVALGVHLYHGGWSLFQSMGWNNRRFNHWRRSFAIGFAAVVTLGNLSFPIAILLGIVG
ncbi:succinate dehydrogenase cytochrome b subunit [Nitriliruptoraceae bacterium ZYF776]|nr:succinate dehydrogenase cytochrome b subunit [Profundirhabdus halotolerans]